MSDTTQTQLEEMTRSALRRAGMSAAQAREAAPRVVDVLAQHIVAELVPHLSDEERFVLRDMLSDGALSDEEIRLFVQDVMRKHRAAVAETMRAFFAQLYDSLRTPRAARTDGAHDARSAREGDDAQDDGGA